MEVLIVAKTHMRNGSCVGGYDITSKRNVRLLNANAENQPHDTEFNVGQVWEIEYAIRPVLNPPHIEDVLVLSKNFIREEKNPYTFLLNSVKIWKGDPTCIFDGKVNFPRGKSCFVTNTRGIPSQSVGFWMADKDLELTIFGDQKHFYYFGEYGDVYAIPFVGFQPVEDKIKKGSIIRVSLARWWNPNPNEDKRCYCQLSGWFMQ
ncbi:MAG: hypothetical protein A2W93_10000 [Bacteroidetes bacterium GWF2_43_63]|nr:MAG: hypothetical protein A2W94_02465 [Bacteroidetes bacterium GWE2_42_42]OFY52855.1 MAG: hypothetical protein A2W93_10000 [Bacteroidetes bacterium GWF2_43_63]HBG70061.1 hypothetical protein [Bacteroidales bacterium]HCB62333.1 hypothetical protein [Bacteroidales bacterium]